jgi:hypothetical protein
LSQPVISSSGFNQDVNTEFSSQKSTKAVRTNGLSKVEKPSISNSKISSKGEDFRKSSVGQSSFVIQYLSSPRQ